MDLDKLLESTAACEISLSNLPTESLEEMLTSIQVSIYDNILNLI